jgi:hypothetical protein
MTTPFKTRSIYVAVRYIACQSIGPFIPIGKITLSCVVSRKHAKTSGKWTLLAPGSDAKKLQSFFQVATVYGAKRYRTASGDSSKKPFAKGADIRHISIVVLTHIVGERTQPRE